MSFRLPLKLLPPVLLPLALVAAACSRPDHESGGDAPAPGSKPATTASISPDDDAIVPVIGEGEIVAIDSPIFAAAAEAAEFMRAEEPVVGLAVGGKARAYSLWHLDRHEIVNDRAGDVPLVVAWCPLAYTARAFERRAGGRELTFGVSGRLWRNALVMRDRETGSLWSQVNGAAIEGPLAGAELTALPVGVTRWADWSSLHPKTLVLRKPPLSGTLYPDYFNDPARVGYYGQKRRDPRLEPKAQVIGVESGGRAVAVPLELLRTRRLWNDRAGAEPVLLVSLGEEGPELAYRRRVGGTELSLELRKEARRARDRETGTLWDLGTGAALSGPLAGTRLEPLDCLRAFWFIWSAYHPHTELRSADDAGGIAGG